MIPSSLVTAVRDIRKRFLEAMEQLDQTASFKALVSGSETLRGEWDELQKIAHSPRMVRECVAQFTCAIVGSSSHGKTSILSEMFPSLTQRGWLVTAVTDTTSQALVIRRAQAGDGKEDEVIVHSWNLEQIKRLVKAADAEDARLNIHVAYRPDFIEVDGKEAAFAPEERRHFRFDVRQKLRALGRSCLLTKQQSADRALIYALTVKESSDRVRTDPVLTVDGQPFHALQLRAVVKDVELRDPFQQLAAWSGQDAGDMDCLVFIDTPGLNVTGSIKDEVLRAVLGRKNQQIVVELIRNDELDLIVHLVLAGGQSAFAQLWGPLNKECRPEDLDDLSERLVLAINGTNILLTNDDLTRKWDSKVSQFEGDPFAVVLESNILHKMSEVGSFRPAKICFMDSQRIVESSFGRPYQDFYAAHRNRLQECLSPHGVGYDTLQRLDLLESFRENIAALCDPADRGQGFLVRQILALIRERGARLFVRKHLIRSRLARGIKKLREILSRHYDAAGRLNRQAVLATVRTCLPDINPDKPESIEAFYLQHFKNEIDGLVPGPGEVVDVQTWVNQAFKKLCNLLYSKASPPNANLREVFKKYALELMGQWRLRWGYKNAELPAPTRQYPDSAELLRHALHVHIREMLYQLVTGDSAGAADVHQDAEDQKRVQTVAQTTEQIDRLVVSAVCRDWSPTVIPPPQFIVVPLTGIQICRRIPLPQFTDQEWKQVWDAAKQLGDKPRVRNPLLPLIQKHIACDNLAPADCTGWIARDANEAVFYRLLRPGADYAIDLVIDTQNGAGRTAGNLVKCLLETGMVFRKKQHHLATIVVEENSKPRNDVGSLILDFGNTATSAIFSARDARPLETRPIYFHNPWDPHEADEELRPTREKCILRSTTFMLRVPETDVGSPWVVLGKQAEELIRQQPMATSLFAPKKYIRDWAEHLKAEEPTTTYRGIMGQQLGLFPKLLFVRWSLTHMMELVLSTLVNPGFGAATPDRYPQVAEVLLTYPLTWREADKELFRRMVQTISEQLFVLKPEVREHFKVDLICSEPVAVAIYALWEVFSRLFALSPKGANLLQPSLASSFLGNLEGTQELRLLVVDIGGGSTDIALLEASWKVLADDSGDHVEVRTRVLESLRFNRAGDRLSHLMATAIMEFFRHKYGIAESLDFAVPSGKLAFTASIKREVVSRIMELVEQAKVKLAGSAEPWVLEEQDEKALHDLFQSVLAAQPAENALDQGACLQISRGVLREWIEEDYGSIKTNGEPGFMDIFAYLREMRHSLSERNCLPHLIILSGRTTRLPFIRQMTAQHLGVPLHRVRTLADLLPSNLKGPDHENMDKLAVVCGAHRLRFGDPIRFIPLPEEPIFKRFIGTIAGTPAGGARINKVLVKPGESQPATCGVRVPPAGSLLIGHSFRDSGDRAEVIVTLSNSTREPRDVEIDISDDYTIMLRKTKDSAGVILTEWIPGGTSLIVDNFNDTGRIDREPEGFLRNIVCHKKDEWIKPQG